MGAYSQRHLRSTLLALGLMSASQTILARAPEASSASHTPTWLAVPVVLGLGWLAWLTRIDLESMIKRFLTPLVSRLIRLSRTIAERGERVLQQPGSPERREEDDGEKTVVVQRAHFGSITCVSGALVGQRWEIPANGLSLGRDAESDVVVNDSRVSGRHAEVRPKQGSIIILDCASTNGVFLNDFQHRVNAEAPLKPGDIFMLSPSDAAHFIYRK